ncbi:hypothetical protein SDJN03_27125, partial [Cucurbita argyrosperma subsp. sororia]
MTTICNGLMQWALETITNGISNAGLLRHYNHGRHYITNAKDLCWFSQGSLFFAFGVSAGLLQISVTGNLEVMVASMNSIYRRG